MTIRITSTFFMVNRIMNTGCHAIINTPIGNENSITLCLTIIMIDFFYIYSSLRLITISTSTFT